MIIFPFFPIMAFPFSETLQKVQGQLQGSFKISGNLLRLFHFPKGLLILRRKPYLKAFIISTHECLAAMVTVFKIFISKRKTILIIHYKAKAYETANNEESNE